MHSAAARRATRGRINYIKSTPTGDARGTAPAPRTSAAAADAGIHAGAPTHRLLPTPPAVAVAGPASSSASTSAPAGPALSCRVLVPSIGPSGAVRAPARERSRRRGSEGDAVRTLRMISRTSASWFTVTFAPSAAFSGIAADATAS